MPKLKQIIGHETILTELQRDIDSDNVTHAYLFAGPSHVGKMTVAHWFAHQLLCLGKEGEAAEDCRRQFENLTHSDFLVLDQLWMEDEADDWDQIAKTSNVPQQHRAKAKAKTNSISIDDVRALQQRLHETSLGKYRCCIIRSVDRMQDAAANAFLKILEEPPAGLVFILTTQSAAKLLPTIVSRSRVLRFQSLPRENLQPLLHNFSDEEAGLVLRIAQGTPGIVIELADNPDLLREHKVTYAQARAFWQAASLLDRLKLLKPLEKRGEESDRLLLHLALSLREEKAPKASVEALNRLVNDLQTNAHRQILTQRFAIDLSV